MKTDRNLGRLTEPTPGEELWQGRNHLEVEILRKEILLPADARAARLARSTLTSAVPPPELQARLDEVCLAVSEVVSNAVRHGRLDPNRDSLRLVIEADDTHVRVEVEQPTPAGVEVDFGSGRTGGFGLRILEETADEWGHVPGPPGRVWFEFRSAI